MTEYTATTTNATNTINATATDSSSTITITNNDVAFENGTAITWEDGENAVEITVTSGSKNRVYTVVVTKS